MTEISWLKSSMPVLAAILAFILALTVLPILRARNEKNRLTLLRKALVIWLEVISNKLDDQTKFLSKFISSVKEKGFETDLPFLVVDFPVDHLLSFKDEDLRKVLYENIKGKQNPIEYVNLINDLRFIKAHQSHINETYDKWLSTKDTEMYLPIFEIILIETNLCNKTITDFLKENKNAEIRNEWWIWA